MSKRTSTTITPDLAKQLLKKNRCKRLLRRAVVDDYAERMRSGAWRVYEEGSSMTWDEDGNLLDGQHRCTAIVETGIFLVGVPLILVTKTKPRVVIQCPHCQNTGLPGEESIYLTWNEVAYAHVHTGEIEGNFVPVANSEPDVVTENKLVCDNCDGEWAVPKKVEFIW